MEQKVDEIDFKIIIQSIRGESKKNTQLNQKIFQDERHQRKL